MRDWFENNVHSNHYNLLRNENTELYHPMLWTNVNILMKLPDFRKLQRQLNKEALPSTLYISILWGMTISINSTNFGKEVFMETAYVTAENNEHYYIE